MNKFLSSATIWLGSISTFLGSGLDYLYAAEVTFGGGIRQQIADLGLDPHTTGIVLSAIGPLIVIARCRTLWRTNGPHQ